MIKLGLYKTSLLLLSNLKLFKTKLNFCAHYSEVVHSEAITIRAIANSFIKYQRDSYQWYQCFVFKLLRTVPSDAQPPF